MRATAGSAGLWYLPGFLEPSECLELRSEHLNANISPPDQACARMRRGFFQALQGKVAARGSMIPNAHRDSLSLKMERIRAENLFFQRLISSP